MWLRPLKQYCAIWFNIASSDSYYAIWIYIVSYEIVLRFIILCWVIQSYIASCESILCLVVSNCAISFHIALWNIAFYDLILRLIIHIKQYEFILRHMILYCAIWSCIMSRKLILRFFVLYCAIRFHITSYEMVLSYDLKLGPMNYIAQSDLILRPILWNNIAFNGLWFHMAQCKFTWCSIYIMWNNIVFYDLYCAIWYNIRHSILCLIN